MGSINKTSDSLIRASIVILIAYGIFHATNFFYHFFSARLLGPAEYSIVASLFSIIYMISIGSTTIQNVVTKFTAEFKAKNENNKIIFLFRKGMKKLSIYAIILLVLYVLASPLIANFLKISLIPVLILSPYILLSILIPFNRGILQGLQKFKSLGINMIIDGVVKLISALILIYLGLKANGAIAAPVIGTAVAFAFTFPLLRFNNKISNVKISSKEIYKFTIVSFTALFLITAIYNIDIFLVKHFFSAEIAGHYAALSLMGKIVFFGATAIGITMFPKISELTNKKRIECVFKKSFLFTFLITVIVVIIYFLFPKLLIKFVFGQEYLDIANLLGLFGIFMSLVSLSYICILKKLAIGKKKFVWILLSAVIMEIILISLFHNSLSKVIHILILINSILLILLLK
ncbi:MAG: oligosaccharide flippase family protein [Candidatus Pacearchaeota archaeon]